MRFQRGDPEAAERKTCEAGKACLRECALLQEKNGRERSNAGGYPVSGRLT